MGISHPNDDNMQQRFEKSRQISNEKAAQIIEKMKNGTLTRADIHQTRLGHYLNSEGRESVELKTRYIETGLSLWAFLAGVYDDTDKPPTFEREYCASCGQRITYTLHGDALVADIAECRYEDAITVLVAIKSGRLIVSDWPHLGAELLLYKLKLDEDECGNMHDINSRRGIHERIKKYAAHNVIHFYVGNSDPTTFKKGDQYIVGESHYDEAGDEQPPLDGFAAVGSICTDLRWFTAVDAVDAVDYEALLIDTYGKDAAADHLQDVIDKADFIMDVKPGTYALTYASGREKGEAIYGSFSWVSDNAE